MKFTNKFSIIVCSLTTAFLHTAVITNTYKSAAQAEGEELIFNGGFGFEIYTLIDPNFINPNLTGLTKFGDSIDTSAEAKGQELIFNGGFEIDPLIDPNNPNVTNPNVTGWIKSGDSIDTSVIKISNFPKTGNQGLSLGGFSSISYISQTIRTVPGKNYQLTYYLASIEEAPDLENKFQVFIGGKKVYVKNNTSYQPYTKYTLNFKAKGRSTEIKFGSIAKYGFLYLDDVSVKARP